MSARIFRETAVVALFIMNLVSGQLSPWTNTTYGWMTNDALGTAWTLLWPGNYTAGNLIVLSNFTENMSSQMFYQDKYYYVNGTTAFYQYRCGSTGFLGFVQYTSSYNYARNYQILQTGAKWSDAANFTLLPGKDAGSVYMQYNTTTGHGTEQVSWYQYTSPSNPAIPVIHDAITVPQEENQSWTWHVAAG